MDKVEIKDISGNLLLTTSIEEGSKRKFLLMKEDYITLNFSLEEPVHFKPGDYVDDPRFGLFELCDLQKPTYNTSTGGYDYDLRLDAYYWKWKNKIFKYTPEAAGQEASWNHTAPLDVQLGVFLRNLKALGYAYRGQDFEFSIDSSVENKSLPMGYDNTNLIDALSRMAETWECEWWVNGNQICFGRCEWGDPVDFEMGVNVEEMTRSESQSTYATRIYAFGSTRNLPAGYRPVDESVVVNGVVQRRLMLPVGTPYIDAYPNMRTEEAVEQVVIFDDIYPRRVGTMSGITTHEYTDKIEEEGKEPVYKKWNAYRFKDTGITFSKDYVLPGEELQITFHSGKLNGMTFAVTFNPCDKEGGETPIPEKLEDGSWNPAAQVWEIVRNEDYGRQLPGDVLIPGNGDTYVLSGFDTKFVSVQMLPDAENELKERAQKYIAKTQTDPSTYENRMMPDSLYSEGGLHKLLEVGDRVNLINKAYFDTGSRQSRIIGLEYNLDIPYDHPVYTVGETASYSRIGELEEKLDSLTLAGQTYTGGGGSGIYVIGTNDNTPATNRNVFSALKALAIFLRKDIAESVKYLMTFLGGVVIRKFAKFGDFLTGISGGYIDEKGDMEMNSGVFRKRLFVPEIAYNRITYFKGRMVLSPGGGCTVLSYVDNGDGTYTITPDLTDADGLSQFVDDILTTYFVTKNAEGKLNGFEEMKFRVTAADYAAKKFTVIPRPGHAGWKPAEQMVLSHTGNFTDPERQTYILMDSVNGNNNITYFDNANTWDPEPAQMPAWLGKKKGMKIAGIDCDNYSAVLQHIIMTGLIFQIDEITGDTVRVPIDKGAWVAGQYGYYDRVSHNGALWLCVNDKGTTSEPSESNPDWLKQVSEGQKGDKGDKGDSGLSVIGGGHWESSKTPYAANTMVSFANSVFLSKLETSNPPIAIARFKNGAFRRKKDGGYILAGKSTDWEVNEDWEMLLDGRELKGESITFLGRFDTPPSNPIEGNSYYNTVDRATYIYHNGQWIMSVSDGKDGTDYEYIYQRGNSIGNPPTKPDSRQEDDYVPEGWTDDFLGVDAAHQVEWGCKRVKEDGKWSEFSNPAIVHRWSLDGENAIMADFDNEMVNCALTSDGNAVSSQFWKTTVSMWYGTEKMELDSITCTPDTNLLCATDKTTGEVTVSVSAGAALAATNTVKITVRATRSGQQYSRDLTFTVAGVRGGANGSDAVLYSILTSVSSVIKDKNDRYSVASVSCKRMKTVGSVTSTTTDGELKYSIDGGAEFSLAGNAEVPSSDFTNTLRFVFYVDGQIVDVETVPMLTDGKDGADGLSVVGGGHWELSGTPYKANTLVSFANCVFLSKIDTSNPPLAISRFKSGAYRRKKDGGYILAGSSFDWQVHPDWDMLLDGRELKGTSITFLGRFETAPANPSEGNSYYNTTDKCTYIYQNGVWMVMVIDGKDAKDYEWIYQRTNIIGLPPEKPDSKQQDDYVPSGWTDDFLGVDQDHQIEWACKRTKRDGVWSEFSTPAVVHRWSKDGESVIGADLDNEMASAALTSAGVTTAAQSWTTHASLWYGTEKLPLETLTVNAPTGFAVSTSKSLGAVAISVAAGKSLAEQNVVTITVGATKNGQLYTRELIFRIAGIRGGADGSDAVLYSLVTSASSVKKDKNGNYSGASVSCKRMKTVGAVTSATTEGELKYSRDGAAEVPIGDNIGVASGNFTKSLKFVYYVGGQVVDVETVPMLIDGGDGNGIRSVDVLYYLSTSATALSGGSWVTTAPAWQNGTYMWTKTKVVYTDGTQTETRPVCITGGKGNDGKGISGIIEQYYLSTSATGLSGGSWVNTPPLWQNGKYMWTRSIITYTDGTTTTTSAICVTGGKGNDGESIVSAGHWEASKTPYKANRVVEFAGGSYLSKVETSNPPIAIARFKNGKYRRKRDGGYILAGRSATRSVHPDWQQMVSPSDPSTSYWLDSPVSTINFTSTGTPSPSAFLVTCKQNVAGNVSTRNTLYLAARKYNGSWLAHVGAQQTSAISVPATAGYTQFAVRAYTSAGDANAWNDSYVAEKGIGIAIDGKPGDKGDTGATGAFPRDRGVFGTNDGFGAYVWNADYRDKVIHMIGGVYYNFLVRNYGASVTAAPTSANGDSNWEAMQKFVNIATDTLFADGANVAGFMFKNKVLKSRNDEGETLLINGETGYLKCKLADITGTIRAKDGYFAGELRSVTGSFRSLACLDGSGNTVGTLTFTSAGQLSFDGDIYSQGTRDSRSLRFYASDVWVRGAFGARTRTVLKVEGKIGYFYSKGINKAPISISLSSGVSPSGITYYKIPCYGLSGDYAGMPVDTVVFTINVEPRYAYELEMPESQRVTLINAQDNYNNVSIFANGVVFLLNGGCACMVQNIYSLMTPKPTNKIGAGLIIIGGIHDNNWR